jgi:hypothetical protein
MSVCWRGRDIVGEDTDGNTATRMYGHCFSYYQLPITSNITIFRPNKYDVVVTHASHTHTHKLSHGDDNNQQIRLDHESVHDGVKLTNQFFVVGLSNQITKEHGK